MGLANKGGVSKDTAELVTENMVATIRTDNRVSRVITLAEVRAAMSFDVQKQLANCDSSSCLAEIAGTMGVDYLVLGSLGKVGGIWVYNLSLVEAATGTGVATVSRTIEAPNESGLLLAVEDVVDELLTRRLGPRSTPAPRAVSKPSGDSPAQDAASPAPQGAADTQRSGSAWPLVLRVLGVVGLASALPTVVAGLAGGGFSLALAVLYQFVVPGLDKLWVPLQAASLGGIGVLGAGAALAVLGVALGTVFLVASVVAS